MTPEIADLQSALDSLPRELRDRLPRTLGDILPMLGKNGDLWERDAAAALNLFIVWALAKEKELEAVKKLYIDLANLTPPPGRRIPSTPMPCNEILLAPPEPYYPMLGLDFGLGESQSVPYLVQTFPDRPPMLHIDIEAIDTRPDAPHKRRGKSKLAGKSWSQVIQELVDAEEKTNGR